MFQGLITCDCQSVLQAGILSERNEYALLSLLPPRRRDVDAAILNTELVPRSQWIEMNLICRRRSVPMSEPGLSYALTWDSLQSYFYPSLTSRRHRHRGLESQPQASGALLEATVSVDVMTALTILAGSLDTAGRIETLGTMLLLVHLSFLIGSGNADCIPDMQPAFPIT